MKFLNLAIMLFLFNVAIGIVQYTTVLDSNYTYDQTWINQVSSPEMLNQSYEQSKITDPTLDQGEYGNFKLGLANFLELIFHAVFGLYFLLVTFGVPGGLAALFSAPFYFMYLLGIYQFFSKSSVEDYK